jgi:hypothetical protein
LDITKADMMAFVQGNDQNMKNTENVRADQELPHDHAQLGIILADENELCIVKYDIYHE